MEFNIDAISQKDKYTIIFTRFQYGQMIYAVDKEKVKTECEKLKHLNKLNEENAYIRIEVVNNNTGEIREYWNNKENTINSNAQTPKERSQ